MKFQDVGTAAPWQLEETIYLHQETFTLTEFSLQLVATLDYIAYFCRTPSMVSMRFGKLT